MEKHWALHRRKQQASRSSPVTLQHVNPECRKQAGELENVNLYSHAQDVVSGARQFPSCMGATGAHPLLVQKGFRRVRSSHGETSPMASQVPSEPAGRRGCLAFPPDRTPNPRPHAFSYILAGRRPSTASEPASSPPPPFWSQPLFQIALLEMSPAREHKAAVSSTAERGHVSRRILRNEDVWRLLAHFPLVQ